MNDNENRLQQEILENAERQGQQAISQAHSTVAKALATLQEDQAKARAEQLAEAQRDADAACRAIAARVRYEVQRRWLTLREQGFEQVFEQLLPRLASAADMDRARSLRQLLQEAVEAVGSADLVVRVSPDSAALLTDQVIAEVLAQIQTGAGTPVNVRRVVDEALQPGLVVESADGRRLFDNTYATRLQRLRGPLRLLACAGLATAESDAAHA